MATTAERIRRQIMRRVYYAFLIRTVLHPAVVHGALVVASVLVLTYFVSFPNVIANLLQVKVGEVHRYLLEALMYTESWTVVLLGFALMNVAVLIVRTREPFALERHEMAYVK